MNDHTTRDTGSAMSLEARQRAANGIVAAYIHELSDRHHHHRASPVEQGGAEGPIGPSHGG